MIGVTVKADFLEFVVRVIEDGAAGRFIHAAALHADQTVFYHIGNADAVLAAQFVEGCDHSGTVQLFAVERHGNALFKGQGDIGRLVGSLFRRNAHFENLVIHRLVPRIF